MEKVKRKSKEGVKSVEQRRKSKERKSNRGRVKRESIEKERIKSGKSEEKSYASRANPNSLGHFFQWLIQTTQMIISIAPLAHDQESPVLAHVAYVI